MWKGSWAPSRNLLPFMGGPGLQFGCMEFGRHTGPDRLPKGALPGAQNGAGSVPDASMERKRRHRVQYGFYLLRSTSAARIGVRNGLKNGTGRDIGLRLGLAPEKCFPRAPKGLPKWTPKCCKNEKMPPNPALIRKGRHRVHPVIYQLRSTSVSSQAGLKAACKRRRVRGASFHEN